MKMNKKVKKICIILIITIIAIIAIIVALLLSLKSNADMLTEQEEEQQFDQGMTYEPNDNGFTILNDSNMFYTVINTLAKYIQCLAYNENMDIEQNSLSIANKEEQKEAILAMLDSTYTNKNAIDENYEEKIQLINYEYNLIPIQIKVRYEENIIEYLVNVYIENANDFSIEEKYYVVRIDNRNGSFSIEPIDEVNEDIDSIPVEKINNAIEKNQYNQYYLETISIERLVKIYMDFFTSMALKHPDIIYNKYLDNEYKEKRFENEEDFNNYVEKNREEIEQIRATKYLLDNSDNKTKYVLMDQYNNTYEFYEESTMVYKVRMDTYTIPAEKFLEEYNTSNEQKKVMLNVDKWIEMLNNRDYKHAYNVLDETFRNNSIGTEEDFEKYIKEHCPSHYEVEYKEFNKEGNTYIQGIELKDIENEEAPVIKINIIMQLLQDINFTMSFSINS